ncbi:MAG: hypothetical protein S4CHLAM2_18190 [Chlamydiales bacterium]|nr:hypothetical protein [Chlamydiales bacterium]
MAAAAAGISNDFNHAQFIQKLFPRADYQAKQTAGLPAHYLIALGQSSESIKEFLSKRITKVAGGKTENRDLDNATKVLILDETRGEILNRTSEEKYGLTMAHVAVLAQRIDVLRDLKKLGAGPKKVDYLGWTLAHHAIVIANGDTDNAIVKFVVEWMGGEEAAGGIRNRFGGSYRDFEALLKSDSTLPDETPVCKIRRAGGEVKECTARQFKEISEGRDYVPAAVVTPRGLYAHWTSKTYNTWVSIYNGPLTPTTDAYCIAETESVGHSLVATADIAQGVFLNVFYGGEFKHEEGKPQNGAPDRVYDLKTVSAESKQSELAKMNAGFPNLQFVTVARKGIPQVAFQTLVPIKPGDQLLWNYGGEYGLDNTFPMFELNPQALIHYVLETELADKISSFSHPQDFISFCHGNTRIQYILVNPTAWITLYENDFIDLINVILNALGFFAGTEANERRIQIIKLILDIDSLLPDADKVTFKDILQSWNHSLGTPSMATAISMLRHLLNNKLDLGKAIDDTNQIVKMLGFFRFQEGGSTFLGDRDYLSKSKAYYDSLSCQESKSLCLEILQAYMEQAGVEELAELLTHPSGQTD